MIDQLRAELHKLATSTSPDADRCADALAALVEPLAPRWKPSRCAPRTRRTTRGSGS